MLLKTLLFTNCKMVSKCHQTLCDQGLGNFLASSIPHSPSLWPLQLYSSLSALAVYTVSFLVCCSVTEFSL